MNKLLSLVAVLFIVLSTTQASANIVTDLNKIESHATDVVPKVIAGSLLIAVAGSTAFTILGGGAAKLGTRLAISILVIAITFIIAINTEVGEILNDLLNISNAKSMFKKS